MPDTPDRFGRLRLGQAAEFAHHFLRAPVTLPDVDSGDRKFYLRLQAENVASVMLDLFPELLSVEDIVEHVEIYEGVLGRLRQPASQEGVSRVVLTSRVAACTAMRSGNVCGWRLVLSLDKPKGRKPYGHELVSEGVLMRGLTESGTSCPMKLLSPSRSAPWCHASFAFTVMPWSQV